MARLRFNFISGSLSSPLIAESEILVSDGLKELPTIATPDYVALIIDPVQIAGDPEIVYVIEHEDDSDVATVMRGQEETLPRDHTAGMQWVHGAVAKDFAQYYVHHQAVSSNVWFIQHNLGRYPGITVVDSAGNVVVGDIQYNDNTSITITFSASFGGKAYLD